jgi:hypothetical protein
MGGRWVASTPRCVRKCIRPIFSASPRARFRRCWAVPACSSFGPPISAFRGSSPMVVFCSQALALWFGSLTADNSGATPTFADFQFGLILGAATAKNYSVFKYSSSACFSDEDNCVVPNSCPHRLLPESRAAQSVVFIVALNRVCWAARPTFTMS